MATNYLDQQAEVINKKLPYWFGHMAGPWFNKIKKSTSVERIGERDFRAPFKKTDGGKFGTYNPNGGSVGAGSAAEYGVGIGTFFSMRFCMQLTELAMKATKDSKVSKEDALKKAVASGLPNFMGHVDQVYHGDGTAVVGTATAHSVVSSVSVYTMDDITGVKNFRVGSTVIPYQSDLSAARDSGAERTVTKINYATRQITLDATVTSAAATDKMCFAGVSGASPLGPWGLKYFTNTASTGTTYGINRANVPEIIPEFVNVGGVPTVQKSLQLQIQYMERRKKDANWECFTAPRNVAHMYQQVYGLGQVDLLGGAKLSKDLMPEGMVKNLRWGGLKVNVDWHHDNDTISGINFDDMLRLQLPGGELQFWDTPGGQKFFQIVDTTTGIPKSETWFAWTCHENLFHANTGENAVWNGITAPSY